MFKHLYHLFIFSLLLMFGINPTNAATFTVNNNNDNGSGSLRDAVSQANAATGADTINFAAGVTGLITLTSGEISITEELTIDGDTNDITISGNDSSRIFYASANLNLQSLTLSNGQASNRGGVIYSLSSSTVNINNSTLSGNSASYGGAVYAYGDLSITNSSLLNNSTTTSSGDGGAIYARGNSVTITNSSLSNNTVNDDGGAIYGYSSSNIIITNSSLSNNSANFYGGAITAYGNLSIVDSTLSNNTTNNNGGAIYTGSALTISNSTLSANSANDTGGAIWSGGNLTITNSTLAGNSANNNGGMLHSYGGSGTLNSNILQGNTAAGSANNCYFSRGGSIDAGNSSYNLLDEGCGLSNGTNNNIVDSALVVSDVLSPLADNGCAILAGPSCVQTMGLVSGSPAIDAGSNPNNLTMDQRGSGYPRVNNGQADIGAYEFLPTYTVGGTISGLIGSIVLQNNGGDDLTINADGSFTFPTALPNGATYSITILTPPSGQTCTITNGSGTLSGSNVGNIQIACRATVIAPVPTVSGYGIILMVFIMLGLSWLGVRRS